jgi:hypothetical protein
MSHNQQTDDDDDDTRLHAMETLRPDGMGWEGGASTSQP